MASSSNMALPRANDSLYDVFLSFRGEDTRHTFSDHLYEALVAAGLLIFRDNNAAERGEKLNQQLEKAIKSSDASIIVLSENYATSTWCLDELSLILDQMRGCNHYVLPVFFHVDPSDVCKHRKSFMIETKPIGRWTEDNVNRWKAALTEVTSLVGMHLVDGRSEATFKKEVVNVIVKRFAGKEFPIPPYVTGMDARYKEIYDSWLSQSSEANFLVIYGMPGSGKSTLARYIVHFECGRYERCSIVENIATMCEQHKMVNLQQQLCYDISKGNDVTIHTVSQGTCEINRLLANKKTLIVLDDIVEEQQLKELLGSCNMNKESKVIITSNISIASWSIFSSKRCQEYELKLLSDDDSLELLSLHAFRSKIPKDGYKELAQQVVQYCERNPLALKVLGSSLSSKNTSVDLWKSEWSLSEKGLHDGIYKVLVKGIHSLPKEEKELFLHIACFFVAEDLDYVVNILDPDYAAKSRIQDLIKRSFFYVTNENKIMMHGLLKDTGRRLVDEESKEVAKRSRVWRNKDSYNMLRRNKSSRTMGLALDIPMLMEDDDFVVRQSNKLSTDALQQDELKYLKLKLADKKLTGSYEDFSVNLRWLCWNGFSESTIHTEINMKNMVALDMSNSCLEEFEPPTVLSSLKFLDLKESHSLLKIHRIDRIPNLEKLILWNCDNLFHVCKTIGNIERLSLLKMTGCKKLNTRDQLHTSVDLEASTSGEEIADEPSFPLPHFLRTLFLNECNLVSTDNFPLSFRDQASLQYINLGSGLFEILPSYSCLENLRVLDLKNCRRLKSLLCLPSQLAQLCVYGCTSIEKITFESGGFTLQEFGYEGCIILSEVQGLFKLLLVSKLDKTELGHMIWLQEYQTHEVYLVGDHELTEGRSRNLQMLYELNIMSTSLPDIKHVPKPDYTSQTDTLSFTVPSCPSSRSLKGMNVTFRYTISSGEEDMVWSAKISITNSSNDLIYSPKVFGKPEVGKVVIWFSYWPIGNSLKVGDEVIVSINVVSRLVVLECGASLVYTDEDAAGEISEIRMGWAESLGINMSRFQLSNGSYFICQRDLYKLMEIGRIDPGWLSILIGDSIDDTEVRGWRMTGRPQQSYQSFTKLKTGTCIIHNSGEEMEIDQIVPKVITSSVYDGPGESQEMEIDQIVSKVITSREEMTLTSSSSVYDPLRGSQISNASMASSSAAGSWKYDVFLSFRGEDTRKNYVDHLYKVLYDQGILTYKDDKSLPRGDTIDPSLKKAIEGSIIAVIVFSENYADSSWCLDELVHIMKCRDERGMIVIPIFYKVDPSDVRKLKGRFGRGFAKPKFDKSVKEELWKKAIVDASKISGWQIANGNEAASIKLILETIYKKLFTLDEDVDEDLVGMKTRLQSLEALLDIESGGVHMVGIWGVGGSGKTTLAYSAYQKLSPHFQCHCFIHQIRVESTKHDGLKKVQEKILSALLKTTDVNVQSVEEGKDMIGSRLRLSKVLIVLDDVDQDEQIEALAGSHKWFGDGSRIIITTRDQHLLLRDKVKISHASLLSKDEAFQLIEKHALLKDKPPIEDYDTLSRRMISYADGLPLALKVLGALLRGKDKKVWESVLEKMKNIPNPDIIKKLKISYDGLEPIERKLFLDIACFHMGEDVDDVKEISEACGFYPDDGIKVLMEKALITISEYGRFEMHDLVQEMGHYIVRGQHPKNPEKHSRVWKAEEIVEMCSTESARENNEIEAIRFNGWSSGFSKLVSNMKKLRLLLVHAIEGAHNYSDQDVEGPSFLSNELQYVSYAHYPRSPFPADFHPAKLVVLKLQHTLQKELWKGYKLLPMLKVLHVEHAENLVRTPDFGGFPCLEKVSLIGCCNLEEIDPSLGYCKRLERLDLSECQLEDGKIPGEVGELLNLTEFNLSGNNFSQLPFSLLQLTRLELLDIRRCPKLLNLPELPVTVTTFVGSE